MSEAHVSKELLQEVIAPFVGGADCDDEQIADGDEAAMKKVLQENLPPHYAQFTDDTQVLLKRAIAFYIQKPGFDFLDFWNGYLPAFHASGKQILIWIWETLFPGEATEPFAQDCIEDRTVTAEAFVHYRPRQQ